MGGLAIFDPEILWGLKPVKCCFTFQTIISNRKTNFKKCFRKFWYCFRTYYPGLEYSLKSWKFVECLVSPYLIFVKWSLYCIIGQQKQKKLWRKLLFGTLGNSGGDSGNRVVLNSIPRVFRVRKMASDLRIWVPRIPRCNPICTGTLYRLAKLPCLESAMALRLLS